MKNDFEKGYEKALQDLNTPMQMITEKWEASQCPRCKEYFDEDCDDGYYKRWFHLERCPHCGQKIRWFGKKDYEL